MVLVFVLIWVKSVLRCLLYIFHLSGYRINVLLLCHFTLVGRSTSNGKMVDCFKLYQNGWLLQAFLDEFIALWKLSNRGRQVQAWHCTDPKIVYLKGTNFDIVAIVNKTLRRVDNVYLFGLKVVWPDWAIYWTLGIFSNPLATINLSKSSTLLGNFCKGVKIYHFWATFIGNWQFFLVTLFNSTF